MKNMFQNLAVASVGLVASAAIAPAPAQALSFNFSVVIDTGSLAGQTFTGFFSFDDSTFVGSGFETFDVTDIEFVFAGSTFTEANAIFGPSVDFFDGQLEAVTYIVSEPGADVAFENFFGEQGFSYDLGDGEAGFGDVAFGGPIPEPLTVVGSVIFGGFGALGLKARAKKRKIAA